MSLVDVLQPPSFCTDNFELCFEAGLGLIVFCRICTVVVLLWEPARSIWLDCEDFPYQFYTVRCWGGCGHAVHRPSVQLVRRFEKEHDNIK